MPRFLFEVKDRADRVVIRTVARNPVNLLHRVLTEFNNETGAAEEMINYNITVQMAFADITEVRAYNKSERIEKVNLFKARQTYHYHEEI